jgi:hypothetical protein
VLGVVSRTCRRGVKLSYFLRSFCMSENFFVCRERILEQLPTGSRLIREAFKILSNTL